MKKKLFCIIFVLMGYLVQAQADGLGLSNLELELYSKNGSEIRLSYDLMTNLEIDSTLHAKNFKVVVISDDAGAGDIIKVSLYIDKKLEGRNNDTEKSFQELEFTCAQAGYCEGVFSSSVELAARNWDYKHWMKVSINGKFLVDPLRNLTTFRALLPLN